MTGTRRNPGRFTPRRGGGGTLKLSQELLRAVSLLEISARRNITSLLVGNYRSSFRGSGMQFKEFRHYEPGDDIRHMSWSVTARTRRATLKTYEEERDLDVILLVDVSGSSLFGSRKKRKVDMYVDLVALVGLAAAKSGDNFGLLLFNDRPTFFLPPARGREHVITGIDQILKQGFQGAKSQLGPALRYVGGALHHRSVVVIVSDFLMPSFDRELAIVAKRHEILMLHCFDDAERGVSMDGVYEIRDPETGEFFLLDANSAHTRKVLAEYQLGLTHRLEELCRKSRADFLSLSVEDDYLKRMVHFFNQRDAVGR